MTARRSVEAFVHDALLEAKHPHLVERLELFLQITPADDPGRQRGEQLLRLARERRERARTDEA